MAHRAGFAEVLNENKERLIGWFLKSNQNFRIDFLVQPLSEVVFSEHYTGDFFQIKSRLTLILLATVSLMVLVMAWMNYINLAISRTKVRFKEIAARKVSGAKLMDLITQFIIQSTLVNLLAVLVGLTIIQLIRQPFSDFFDIRIIPLMGDRSEHISIFQCRLFCRPFHYLILPCVDYDANYHTTINGL